MKLIIVMRNEILKSGAPLPLVDVLDSLSTLVDIQNQEVVELWQETANNIAEIITKYIPNTQVDLIPLWEGDEKKEEVCSQYPQVFPVTLDAYDTTGAFPLQVSRHFAPGGTEFLGIGARPGAPELPQQVEVLLGALGTHREVILLEDDVFTGSTALTVLDLLKEQGVSVVSFVPGVQAKKHLSIGDVKVIPVKQYEDYVLDIVDPRDFLFGLQDAGLVIAGEKELYRAPYMYPWVDITGRMGVPKESVVDASTELVMCNQQFYTKLQQIVGREIRLMDLSPHFVKFVRDFMTFSDSGTIMEFCDYAKSTIALTGSKVK